MHARSQAVGLLHVSTDDAFVADAAPLDAGSAEKDRDDDNEKRSRLKMPFCLLSEEPGVSIYVEESRVA